MTPSSYCTRCTDLSVVYKIICLVHCVVYLCSGWLSWTKSRGLWIVREWRSKAQRKQKKVEKEKTSLLCIILHPSISTSTVYALTCWLLCSDESCLTLLWKAYRTPNNHTKAVWINVIPWQCFGLFLVKHWHSFLTSTGSGSLTAALETASSRKATVIGKPSRFMFECIASQFELDPESSLMVGDRLETDIVFGVNCGLSTVLTLTGVSTFEQAQVYKDSDETDKKDFVPDYVVESIADFLEALEE